MDRTRARWLLRLAIVLVVGVGLVVWNTGTGSKDVLTIENRSGQPIARLNVTLGGGSADFQGLAVGHEVTVPIQPGRDTPFAVKGLLADGTEFKIAGGVVREPTTVIVLPGGNVKIQPSGKSNSEAGGHPWT
jgi:hypothetical protein